MPSADPVVAAAHASGLRGLVAMRRIVGRLQHRSLARGWHGWVSHCLARRLEESKARDAARLMRSVLCRIQQRKLALGWEGWRSYLA